MFESELQSASLFAGVVFSLLRPRLRSGQEGVGHVGKAGSSPQGFTAEAPKDFRSEMAAGRSQVTYPLPRLIL